MYNNIYKYACIYLYYTDTPRGERVGDTVVKEPSGKKRFRLSDASGRWSIFYTNISHKHTHLEFVTCTVYTHAARCIQATMSVNIYNINRCERTFISYNIKSIERIMYMWNAFIRLQPIARLWGDHIINIIITINHPSSLCVRLSRRVWQHAPIPLHSPIAIHYI